jgi:hypothetical protein
LPKGTSASVKLALDNAGGALKVAREAYQKGEALGRGSRAEIQESVDLAWDSLEHR